MSAETTIGQQLSFKRGQNSKSEAVESSNSEEASGCRCSWKTTTSNSFKKIDPSTFEVLIEDQLGQGLLERVQANRWCYRLAGIDKGGNNDLFTTKIKGIRDIHSLEKKRRQQGMVWYRDKPSQGRMLLSRRENQGSSVSNLHTHKATLKLGKRVVIWCQNM